ncbi:MAG: 1-deoxy-D-xylulose-5-phosphate synthase, partial [Oribacterium parvum]|nr:1-deoxy-D-xylulose-5-phosphate synthase [Oribacterium parvum]
PYTDPKESPYDLFSIGHTSTSIDLAIGLAKARDLLSGTEKVVAVIGDGSLSGGMALEGLSNAGEQESQLLIILNDNEMSIAENHGGMYKGLKRLRESNGQAEDNLFRAMGLEYLYEEQGNDVESLVKALEKAKSYKKPVVLHIHTAKGKGLKFAEQDKESWHWHLPFHLETGKTREEYDFPGEDIGELTAEFLLAKMKKDPAVLAITAGVPGGMGFHEKQRKEAGKQFVDVGIAEQTGVTLACGAAKNRAKPVFFTSATFLQRAYDQISHDAAINSLPITMVVNSASILGMRDKTHLGLYLLAMANSIPNLLIFAPAFKGEYFSLLDWALEQQEHPVLIFAPEGNVLEDEAPVKKSFFPVSYQEIQRGQKVAIFATGSLYEEGREGAKNFEKKTGIKPSLINPGILSHLDKVYLENLEKDHELVVVLEDGILSGGFAEKIASFYSLKPMKVLSLGLEKEFYDEYDLEALMKEYHMDRESMVERILEVL